LGNGKENAGKLGIYAANSSGQDEKRKGVSMKRTILFLALGLCPLLSFSQETPPAKDKATIVFFREHHMTGGALKPSVYIDGKEVDRLSNGRWFSIEVEPGKHELGSSAKNEAHTLIQAAAGEKTYVQMIITTGTWRGAGRLLQVDPKEAEEKIAKLKPLHGKDGE